MSVVLAFQRRRSLYHYAFGSEQEHIVVYPLLGTAQRVYRAAQKVEYTLRRFVRYFLKIDNYRLPAAQRIDYHAHVVVSPRIRDYDVADIARVDVLLAFEREQSLFLLRLSVLVMRSLLRHVVIVIEVARSVLRRGRLLSITSLPIRVAAVTAVLRSVSRIAVTLLLAARVSLPRVSGIVAPVRRRRSVPLLRISARLGIAPVVVGIIVAFLVVVTPSVSLVPLSS